MPIDQNFNEKKIEKPISIGRDIFESMGKSYYVDKTLLVKDIIDYETAVILFTRPRRFGKTLNMTMLQTFFEIPPDGKDTSHYFKNLKIWQAGEKYRAEQGKRPVIFLSLKEMDYDNFSDVSAAIKAKISEEFLRHGELEDSTLLKNAERDFYNRIAEKRAAENEWAASLRYLCSMLEKHHGEKPLLIIDEYDVPLQKAWLAKKSFFKEMSSFIKNIFSAAFKTNPSLYKGILTGITRVSKESIFSGLNNVETNTIFDEEFSEHFGFTQEEVDSTLEFYGISDKAEDVRNWYDGYIFGSRDMYNPLSFLKYIQKKCTPMAYWANTSDNALMGEMLERIGNEDREKLITLMHGGTINADIDTNIVFPQLKKDPGLIYSLLSQTGYLKSIKTEPLGKGYSCKLKIPNKEIAYIYSDEIIRRFISEGHAMRKGTELLNAITGGDAERIQSLLEEYFIKCCSFMDLTKEQDYHNFILGLIAALAGGYEVLSNREAGKGRYDIVMKPRKNKFCLPGIIFEFKHCKPSKSKNPDIRRQEARLEREAAKALEQIDNQQYITEMQNDGITEIIKYGAAFSGKMAKVMRSAK